MLVDDTEHEEEEELRLVLGSPKSESPFGASIGVQNETLIKINDDADSKYMCCFTIVLFQATISIFFMVIKKLINLL